MLLLFWVVVMRVIQFLEVPTGRFFPFAHGYKKKGKRRGMTEDNSRSSSICEADCNSNLTLDNITTFNTASNGTPNVDILASRDVTTRDLHWLLELGGGGGRREKYPPSIFSLSSTLQHDLSYDDLARNIDANLAEIDMEDFRSEDIHSILALPAMYCGSDLEPHKQGEQFASMSGSLLLKLDAIGADVVSPSTPCKDSAATSQEDEEVSSDDVSMCKSELLFSPVKEASVILPSFSVDSLDCESYDEQELMLTCQANKNNYTIAFEGSFTQCSEDSDYHASEATDSNSWSGQYRLPKIGVRSMDNSMIQSDYVYTTWSKLKRVNDVANKKKDSRGRDLVPTNKAPKSQSLPNLLRQSMTGSEIRLSQLNISLDSDQCVPVYDVSHSSHSRGSSETSQHSFSLVRLFIQQKGASMQSSQLTNSISSCMDGPESAVPINKPNPNLCNGDVVEKTAKMTTLVDEMQTKEDFVQRQRNLLSDNEKGTNASGPAGPLKTCQRVSSGEIPDSRHHLLTGDRNSVLVDSLVEPSPKAAWAENSNEDVEMTNLEMMDNKKKEMMLNYFPNCKSNECQVETDSKYKWKNDLNPDLTSHGTQTKRTNSKECSPTDVPQFNDPYVLNNARGGDSSPCRLRRNSPGFINNSQTTPTLRPRLNVTIAAMKSIGTQIPVHVVDQGIQTSIVDDSQLSNPSCQESVSQTDSLLGRRRAVYVCYPNYSLPDLSFLRTSSSNSNASNAQMFLVDGNSPSPSRETQIPPQQRRDPRPRSCPDVGSIRQRNFRHVKDWDSLNILLPRQVRHLLGEKSNEPDPATDVPKFCRERSHFRFSTFPGYPEQIAVPNGNCVYRYENEEGDKNIEEKNKMPPPLPKRSISLPNGKEDDASTPKSILRKPSPSRSDPDKQERLSLCDLPNHRRDEFFYKRNSLPNGLQQQQQQQQQQQLQHLQQQQFPQHQLRYPTCLPLMEPVQCNTNIILANKSKGMDESRDKADLTSKSGRSKLSAFLATTEPLSDACALAAMLPNVSFSTDDSSTGTLDFDTDEGHCCGNNFCTCEKKGSKKTVSFSERVCIRESCTPEGSPEVGRGVCQPKRPDGSEMTSPASEDGESECPPNEFSVSPPSGDSPSDVGRCFGASEADFSHKKRLLSDVIRASNILVSHFKQIKTDPRTKQAFRQKDMTSIRGQKVLEFLCPALHALLVDGLKSQYYSYFGCIQNSIWSVIEASIQFDPLNRTLNDLVVRLNSEECLRDNPLKFNAFIMGLLNIRSLDSWFASLCSSQALIQRHYEPNGFVFLASSMVPGLFDELLAALQPLASFTFNLDLLLESEFCTELKAESTQIDGGYGKQTKDYQNLQARQGNKTDECGNGSEQWMRSNPNRVQRAKSCVEGSVNNLAKIDAKKRWSGTEVGTKFVQNLDPKWRREDDDEIDVDHLSSFPRPKPEGAANNQYVVATLDDDDDDNVDQPGFKQLQRKWEELSAKSDNNKTEVSITNNTASSIMSNLASRSRIPRLVATKQNKMDESIKATGGEKDLVTELPPNNNNLNNLNKITSPTKHRKPEIANYGSRPVPEGNLSPQKKPPPPSRANSVPMTTNLSRLSASKRVQSPTKVRSNLPRKSNTKKDDDGSAIQRRK